jgi:hypothetical protein
MLHLLGERTYSEIKICMSPSRMRDKKNEISGDINVLSDNKVTTPS